MTRLHPILKNRARHLRHDQTDAERKLWQHLRSREVSGAKFRRQHALGSFIVDFCCVACHLIIELDGGQHANQREADEERTRVLTQLGYRVIRFWNHEVLTDIEVVLEKIFEELKRQRLFLGIASESEVKSPSPSP